VVRSQRRPHRPQGRQLVLCCTVISDQHIGEIHGADPGERDPAERRRVCDHHSAAGTASGGLFDPHVVEVEVGQTLLAVGAANGQNKGVEPKVLEDSLGDGSGGCSAGPAVFLNPVQPLCRQCDDQLFLLVRECVTGAVDDGEGRPRIVLDEVPCVRIAD